MVVMDAGRVVLINREGCELLGYAEGELVGRTRSTRAAPAPKREAPRRAPREG